MSIIYLRFESFAVSTELPSSTARFVGEEALERWRISGAFTYILVHPFAQLSFLKCLQTVSSFIGAGSVLQHPSAS